MPNLQKIALLLVFAVLPLVFIHAVGNITHWLIANTNVSITWPLLILLVGR